MAPENWDWWMERLLHLVSPADGLGRWDPRSGPVLDRPALLKCLAAARAPAARLRLRRLLGERPALPAKDPRDASARAWLAEAVCAENPRRALRLLAGASDARADYYRGAATATA